MQSPWLYDQDKLSYLPKIVYGPVLKANAMSAHAPNHVTCKQGVENNYIFGISNPDMPIHYTTFMEL